MIRKPTLVQSAKITNVVAAALMALSGLALMLLPDLESTQPQRILLAVLFFLNGAARLMGYFSNDLYRLAFQFDFAWGIFSAILAAAIAFAPDKAFDGLPMLLTAYVVLDALLKLQMSVDARRFGMHGWSAMLATSIFLVLCGAACSIALLGDLLSPSIAVGLALCVDGVQNIWITAYAVRVRVRKKNLGERFELKDEE